MVRAMDMQILFENVQNVWIILLSNVLHPTQIEPLKRPSNINWSDWDSLSQHLDSSRLKGTYYLVLTQKEDKSAEP